VRLPQGWHISSDNTLCMVQPHPDPKFHDTTHFIQLKCNLYGCKQAAHNWYQHLSQGLLAEGFTQSKTDPYLYLHQDRLMVFYTDDFLIFATEDSTINALINDLSKMFILEDQGTMQNYLGICIMTDNDTKTINMTQTRVIESIIKDIGLDANSNTKNNPSLLHPAHRSNQHTMH
jgi:hypothetical protein